MDPIAKLTARLEQLAAQGLLRKRDLAPGDSSAPGDSALIDVCSNDYLGYARASVSRETGAPAGSGASRLINGTRSVHRALESELADWVGLDDSLVFSSGYAANVGVVSAIAGPGDLIVSDELNHASIIDGCRLSRARVAVVPHRDPVAVAKALEASGGHDAAWVVTESYFSMDGDSPDLAELRRLCDRHGAGLYVDEAHALGVFGPEGGGLCRATSVRPDVLVGTLGKSVGAQGAFVAGSAELLDFVWNRARSFVFSTAVSPMLAELALARVRRARADDASRARVHGHASRLRELLGPVVAPSSSSGPIFPIILGGPERAARGVAVLRDSGFLAIAIRPPTVPSGACRLRISLNATLTDEDVVRLAAAIHQCLES
jgi:8-amino-7-oxononanoate synthase